MNKTSIDPPRDHRAATVETLGPASKTRKFKFKSKVIAPASIILVIVSLVSLSYILKAEQDSAHDYNNEVIVPMSEAPALNTEPALSKEAASTSDKVPTLDKKEPEEQKTIVVFEPEGLFSDKEKQELMDKLVNPMVDYHPNTFAAIHIEAYSQDKFVGGESDDKYIVTTIGYEGRGGKGGFLYGSKKRGLEYWVPECQETCEFSEDYRQKYPEVVKKYQQ
ncbi:hypothetical protein KY385_00650 [Candidatus Parcubacteria bacterium]|nr:hypothetical protein [Candidatus Parcubacteria bacterium]